MRCTSFLQWGRLSGNNPVLKLFGQTFEDFSEACRALLSQFKHVLPKGSNRVRVRVSGKDRLKAKETDLGSTLGDESSGLVVVDYEGHPIRFNQLEIFEQIVARHKSIRFDVQAALRGAGPVAPWTSTKTRWTAIARASHPPHAHSEKMLSSRRVCCFSLSRWHVYSPKCACKQYRFRTRTWMQSSSRLRTRTEPVR